MGVHIIGVPAATCTQRVLTTLAEKGVTDFTMYKPDMMKGEHKTPAYLAKQPFGVIPVLEDGDFRMFESRAICRYIAEKYADQGTKLVPDPTDLQAAATFEQWASVENSNFDAFASPILEQKVFNVWKGLGTEQKIVDERSTKLKAKLEIFNKILSTQQYMGGDEFSLLDIFYLPNIQLMFDHGEGAFIEEQPNVKAWWDKVSTRDSWTKVGAEKLG